MNNNLTDFISTNNTYINSRFKSMYPSILTELDGIARFGSCIGFLHGLYYGGKEEMADALADKLNRCFSFLNQHTIINVDNKYINDTYCKIWDDGSPLSFGFLKYVYKKDPISYGAITIDGHSYVPWINGGVIFHGLREVFSVQVDNSLGWSVHT